MPKITFVKSARKNYPQAGIKRGESYYWWKFPYGATHMSKTAPRASQTTNSEFLTEIYKILEGIQDMDENVSEQAIRYFVTVSIEKLDELAEECRSKRARMPIWTQDGKGSGKLLADRAIWCEEMATDLNEIDVPIRSHYKKEDEYWAAFNEALTKLKAVEYIGE